MNQFTLALLIALVSCSPAIQPSPQQHASCSWPEIPDNGGCCRDLNENTICDTVEFAEEIERQKQEEYEEAARRARETAQQAGQFARTVMDDIIDAAKQATDYAFVHKGDIVEVRDDMAIVKLVQDANLGVQEIDGRRKELIINTIILNPLERTAIGECIPAEQFIRTNTPSPCDAILNKTFTLDYDAYKRTLPMDWLWLAEHRKQYETLEGQHVGKRQATLYRIRKENERLNLWIDPVTKLPIKAERWQDNTLLESAEYVDLHKI